MEAVFVRLKGVEAVTSGYAGGITENPTYDQLHREDTGHAEVVQVEYDPAVVDYETLLSVFFGTHDPTTLNRQGHDVGEEYRSVIFYMNEEQKSEAEAFIKKLTDDDVFGKPIVTALEPIKKFYPAEAEHQRYYERNQEAGYCQAVINPKLAKLRQRFAPFLRDDA